jgi:hypothetical protein
MLPPFGDRFLDSIARDHFHVDVSLASVLRPGAGLSFRPIPRPGVPASGAPEELLRVDRDPSM